MDVQLFAVGQEVESLIITTGELNRSEQQSKNGSVTEGLTLMPEIETAQQRKYTGSTPVFLLPVFLKSVLGIIYILNIQLNCTS